ncbi:MBL fold metallo-hydrolase [Variovorax sp. LjRoot175]|uniref:MBL fold metallo-hydrolase n=1 Tax=Variovorax sp. LjRoot175 TaxID=3342276 RepID=UPI003ED08BCF
MSPSASPVQATAGLLNTDWNPRDVPAGDHKEPGPMRRLLTILLPFFVAACATAPEPRDLVSRAIDAMGGEAALATVRTVAVNGTVRQYDPEQTYAPGDAPRLTNDSQFTQLTDLVAQASRIQWVKNFHYPYVVTRTFTEIVTPEAGYVAGIDSLERNRQSLQATSPAHAMSGLRLAMTQRELLRVSPWLLLQMRSHPERLSRRADVVIGSLAYPAVHYSSGELAYTVMFDATTGLPARIRTADYDNIWGDVDMDVVLSDWQLQGGVRLPMRQRHEMQGRLIQETVITQWALDTPPAAGTFEPPAAVKSGAPAPATGKLHTQWPIRRQFIGTYLDSDNISFDSRAGTDAGLRFTELAPGVQHQVGGSHNSLIVEMRDHLIVVDAPVTDGQSKWTIAAAHAKYPGKPIRYLVLTHRHMDHAGGLRAFIAEGAQLVVGQGTGEHFRKVLAAPTMRSPDLAVHDFSGTRITEVADRLAFNDGQREVTMHRIDNPHAADMLLVYVAHARLGFVADLWAPGLPLPPRMNPGLQALVNGVRQAGIAPLRFAGGHGSVAPYQLLEDLMARGAN